MFITMDISNNFIHNSMRLYHENMSDYNENMRRYLQLIGDDADFSRINNSNINDTRTPIIATLFRNYFRSTENNNRYEDVIVRPTNDEIERATENIEFIGSLPFSSCPISLDPFRIGEEICRIKHCSHLFKKNALMNWFQTSVRCPVCRYDIRTYEENLNDQNDFNDIVEELLDESRTTPTPNTAASNSTTSILAQTLTSAVRSFVNQELQNLPQHLSNAAEILYSFDIPIDISGNMYRI